MAAASRGSAASAASTGEQDKEEEEGEGTKSEGEENRSSSKSDEAAEAFKEEQRCQTKGATGRWAGCGHRAPRAAAFVGRFGICANNGAERPLGARWANSEVFQTTARFKH